MRAGHEAVLGIISGFGFLVGGLSGQKELSHRGLSGLWWTLVRVTC